MWASWDLYGCDAPKVVTKAWNSPCGKFLDKPPQWIHAAASSESSVSATSYNAVKSLIIAKLSSSFHSVDLLPLVSMTPSYWTSRTEKRIPKVGSTGFLLLDKWIRQTQGEKAETLFKELFKMVQQHNENVYNIIRPPTPEEKRPPR